MAFSLCNKPGRILTMKEALDLNSRFVALFFFIYIISKQGRNRIQKAVADDCPMFTSGTCRCLWSFHWHDWNRKVYLSILIWPRSRHSPLLSLSSNTEPVVNSWQPIISSQDFEKIQLHCYSLKLFLLFFQHVKLLLPPLFFKPSAWDRGLVEGAYVY